jgi:signal transduction histidine kinase
MLFTIIGKTIKDSYTIQEKYHQENLLTKALAIFDLIVDLRHWNAEFGGVYVKSDKLQPNPYLKPGYIKSENNDTLVWINPAFMTRQISDIANQRDGFTLKITSDKLINKKNAPNAYEEKFLAYFLKNPTVPYASEIRGNTFHFMGALKVEQSCLQCHKQQGYKVGDIRGGISVTFDITKENQQLTQISNDKERTTLFLILAALGLLITLFIYHNRRKVDEKKIHNLNKSLEVKVDELDHFNQTLHKKVQDEIAKQRDNENLLIQQSKLAALGEMLGNIAHQWRQPISAVSAIMMNIKWTAIDQGVEKRFLDDRIKEANDQLQYMSQTIDDFRNFFKPNKDKEVFDVFEAINNAYRILKDSLQSHNIQIQFFNKNDLYSYGYPNEFSQVILNILSNAKDVFIERNTKDPKIEIHIVKDDEKIYCNIKDNAGGIKVSIIDKVFDPYFTTKETHGTGIGLYIAKEIIQKHMKGTLQVKNSENGANFIIVLPCVEKEKNENA